MTLVLARVLLPRIFLTDVASDSRSENPFFDFLPFFLLLLAWAIGYELEVRSTSDCHNTVRTHKIYIEKKSRYSYSMLSISLPRRVSAAYLSL